MMFGKSARKHTVTLGTFQIGDLRPVVAGRMMTKAGRVSMRGVWRGRGVKLFECVSPTHASFVSRLMSACSGFFPEVHGVHDSIVICEWVEGRPVSARQLAGTRSYVAQLEDLISRLRAASPEVAGFDYVDDMIRPRFERCCATLGLEPFRDRVLADWSVLSSVARGTSASHPDLTPANMIVAGERIKIVDNELLGVSRAPWFDEMNALFALGAEGRRAAPALHALARPLLDLLRAGHEERLMSAWLMRIAGTRFVAGDPSGVVEMAERSSALHLESSTIWQALRAHADSENHARA